MATRGLCPIRRYRLVPIYEVGHAGGPINVSNSDPQIPIEIQYRFAQTVDRPVICYLVPMNQYKFLVAANNVKKSSLDSLVTANFGIDPNTNGKVTDLTFNSTTGVNDGTAVFDTFPLTTVGIKALALIILDPSNATYVDEMLFLYSGVAFSHNNHHERKTMLELPPLATLSNPTWIQNESQISISFDLELQSGVDEFNVTLHASGSDFSSETIFIYPTLARIFGYSSATYRLDTNLDQIPEGLMLTANVGLFTTDGVSIATPSNEANYPKV